ncbi:MAG: hypothetical protein ACR2G7_13955 [Acidimicrobiales bacterium]
MEPLEESVTQSYSRKWLLLPAGLGVALIVYNLRWAKTHGGTNALPGVLSDIGVSLLLFSVLFWFEKRIERRIIESIRVLSRKDFEDFPETHSEDPLMPGDFQSDTGPEAFAQALMLGIETREYAAVWALSDENLRRCRAQAWIYNNTAELGLPEKHSPEWDELAEKLVFDPLSTGPIWASFAAIEMDTYSELFRGYDSDQWGWSQRRRIVGPHHEVIYLVPLPRSAPHGFMATSATLIEDSRHLLMSCVEEPFGDAPRRYLFAGFGDSAPLAGWPPTWWSMHDPVAWEAHPGMND